MCVGLPTSRSTNAEWPQMDSGGVVFLKHVLLYSSVFGLKSKTSHFVNSKNNNDIIILSKTWCRGDVPTHCPPNNREIIAPSQILSTVNEGRDSGGLII